jgi:hypothetical protein
MDKEVQEAQVEWEVWDILGLQQAHIQRETLMEIQLLVTIPITIITQVDLMAIVGKMEETGMQIVSKGKMV